MASNKVNQRRKLENIAFFPSSIFSAPFAKSLVKCCSFPGCKDRKQSPQKKSLFPRIATYSWGLIALICNRSSIRVLWTLTWNTWLSSHMLISATTSYCGITLLSFAAFHMNSVGHIYPSIRPNLKQVIWTLFKVGVNLNCLLLIWCIPKEFQLQTTKTKVSQGSDKDQVSCTRQPELAAHASWRSDNRAMEISTDMEDTMAVIFIITCHSMLWLSG